MVTIYFSKCSTYKSRDLCSVIIVTCTTDEIDDDSGKYASDGNYVLLFTVAFLLASEHARLHHVFLC